MTAASPPKISLSPRKAAALRVQRISMAITGLIWFAAAMPLLVMVIAYGYSDQAPTALRHATITFDSLLGSPVWSLISPSGTP